VANSKKLSELLLDPGSFNEVEQLRRHRAVGFGLEAKKPYTDGVITGRGADITRAPVTERETNVLLDAVCAGTLTIDQAVDLLAARIG
jgi:acetyl-CoA carboxylase carboxyltransferase component